MKEYEKEYEAVIGLEVHVQLNTESKIFCSCSTEYGAVANTQTCPVCLGHPGVLPVLNEEVLKKAVQTGLALSCSISEFSRFDRKNYFYPDLPKDYQISQFDHPICTKGFLEVELIEKNIKENGKRNTTDETSETKNKTKKKKIGIHRVHMEEDAGKLIHSSSSSSSSFSKSSKSYVDLNRSGVPLLEVVSEPEIRSSQEAYEYLVSLKKILRYIEVSDCNMEEGSLRCDANISLREKGTTELGTKVEIKNLNSFKGVQKSLDYEMIRQREVLGLGERIIEETRLYDADGNKTYSMRTKESAQDYRYFPEPDLLPIVPSPVYIQEIRRELPELPEAKCQRFVEEYSLSWSDATVLTSNRELADYFESANQIYSKNPKRMANWIITELLRVWDGEQNRKNDRKNASQSAPISFQNMAELVEAIDSEKITGKIAKGLFEKLCESKSTETRLSVAELMEKLGLKTVSDESELFKIVQEVLDENPDSIVSYRNGKTKVIGFLVGQVMKKTRGQAHPQKVNEILRKALSS